VAFNRAILESAASQDSSTVAASTFGASSADTMQLSDVPDAAGSIYNSVLNDAVSISGVNQGANNISLSVAENANVSNSYSAKFTASTYIVERSVMTFGPISVTTTRFDYEAIKDLYSRKRTVYVARSSASSDRVVIVPAMNRTVYVPRHPTSADRTSSVST
jgi:hypothetical protein